MPKQKTFTRLHTVEAITDRERTVKVRIAKYQKDGTKQVYFVPEYDGKIISRTFFARKYDAKTVAKSYLEYKLQKQAAA